MVPVEAGNGIGSGRQAEKQGAKQYSECLLTERDHLVDEWYGQLLRLHIDHKYASVLEGLQGQVTLTHQSKCDNLFRRINQSGCGLGQHLIQ